MDDLVSDRPGARLAPRAIRGGELPARARTSRSGSTRSPSCGWSTSATRRCIPADAGALARGDRGDGRRRCSRPGALPMVLGGDHSITVAAECASAPWVHGPLGPRALRHPHRHQRPSRRRRNVAWDDTCVGLWRTDQWTPNRYAQVVLSGYWPGEKEFSLASGTRNHESLLCMTFATSASARWCGARSRRSAPGPAYLTVDVDVLDPAFVPGTGHAGAGRDDRRSTCCSPVRDRGRRARARRRRRRRGDPDRASAPATTPRSSPTA